MDTHESIGKACRPLSFLEQLFEAELVEVARVTHEANRAYCAAMGDGSQLPWEQAADWQRESAVAGVRFALGKHSYLGGLDGHSGEGEAQHNAWMTLKLKDGWRYGDVKDAAEKTHPCLLPYSELPHWQRMKDQLFRAAARVTAAGILSKRLGHAVQF